MIFRSLYQFYFKKKKFSFVKQSQAVFSVCANAFPNEPAHPVVKTSFPSPKTIEFKKNFGTTNCTLATHFPVDLANSLGNYVCDADGNKLLDVFTSIGTNAVGYNHPAMLTAATSDLVQTALASRTGNGFNPMKEMNQVQHDAFMSVAPPGMERVLPSMCGTCANESAFKVAMMNYAQQKRGGWHI